MGEKNYRKNEWEGMGERARLIRKSKHMSLDDVAAAAGVVPSTVSRFENGMIDTLDMADRIAEVYDISIQELLFGHAESNQIYPDFLVGRGYYDRDIEKEIRRRSSGTFPELITWLSEQPISDRYSSGYLYRHVDYETAYKICSYLAYGRDGSVSLKQKTLLKHGIEKALAGTSIPFLFLDDDTGRHVIADNFYYDETTHRLISAMPTLEFFVIENTRDTAVISLGQEAFRLINWMEKNS